MATLQAAQLITDNTGWDFKSKYAIVDDWFLADTPYTLITITTLYLLFVLKLGPEYLKDKKPFQLRTTLIVYNVFQVAMSIMMISVCIDGLSKFGIIQRSCISDTHDSKLALSLLYYYYFICKVSELLDTIFFVLRKKMNQVSFLHVYHHLTTVWSTWYFMKYDPGAWMIFLGAVNSLVHVVMYTYYGLSAFPNLRKYLWWKKYITSMQLIQFMLLIAHLTINIFISECKLSMVATSYFYFNLTLFIYLFSKFYIKAYSQNKQSKSDLNRFGVENNGTNHNEKYTKNDIVSQNKDVKYERVKTGSNMIKNRR